MTTQLPTAKTVIPTHELKLYDLTRTRQGVSNAPGVVLRLTYRDRTVLIGELLEPDGTAPRSWWISGHHLTHPENDEFTFNRLDADSALLSAAVYLLIADSKLSPYQHTMGSGDDVMVTIEAQDGAGNNLRAIVELLSWNSSKTSVRFAVQQINPDGTWKTHEDGRFMLAHRELLWSTVRSWLS